MSKHSANSDPSVTVTTSPFQQRGSYGIILYQKDTIDILQTIEGRGTCSNSLRSEAGVAFAKPAETGEMLIRRGADEVER